MALNLKLNEFHDISLNSNGQLQDIIDVKMVHQNVETILQLWQGENDFYQFSGVQYKKILGKKTNPKIVRQYIYDAVMSVNGVKMMEFNNFIYDTKNRVYTYFLTIITLTNEEIQIEGNTQNDTNN